MEPVSKKWGISLDFFQMIKETKIKRRCSVIHREVNLSAAFYEDVRTGLKTPCMVEGCDSPDQCRVKSQTGLDWRRCPYFGKEA